MMNYENLFPWEFVGILALMAGVAVGIILCIYALKEMSRSRLQNPHKDYVYKDSPSRTRRD